MTFVLLTRPDDSPVSINTNEVVRLTPVPTSGPLQGPITVGTRIEFRNNAHQDVRETIEVVTVRLNAAAATL
jgi:hypothetical protein